MSAFDRAFAGVTRVGLDTSLFIYLIERHPKYLAVSHTIFGRLDAGEWEGFSSVITIVEVLSQPKKRKQPKLEREYNTILLDSKHITLLDIDTEIANAAATLRASHNLRTPDALQIATALAAGCEIFVTNDRALRRVTELRVVTLDDLAPLTE